jgi:hypothetical protein
MGSDRLPQSCAVSGEVGTSEAINEIEGVTPVSRLIKLAVLALFAALIATPASARAPEWVELGEHRVALFEADDQIRVGRDDGVFTRLRFDVSGNDLDIRYIRVRFLNGEEQTINVDRRIREGTSSPELDLVGRRRGIDSIFVRYNSRPIFGGTPRIRIYGLREDFGPPPAPPFPGPGAGRPTILDTRTVRAESDRIEFDVGRQDGLITQIRLRAVDAALLYRAIEITFGNGQTQVIEGIERLEPGEQGKAIDLDGDRRFIRKVVVFKRPSWRPGDVKVELLGLVQPRPAPPAPPRPEAGGYDVIDQQVVNRQSDRVEFSVPRGEGPFSRIKFKALDDAILFRNIQIVSRDGAVQSIDLIERLEAGEESPAIDVDGRGDIAKVIVTKRPSWRPGESRLQLAGLERPRPAPPAPPRPETGRPAVGFPPGWVLIGSGAIAQGTFDRRPERVVLRVGREVGHFQAVGLRVLGAPVRILEVITTFANGDRDRETLSGVVGNRARTQPIKLRRDGFIARIEVLYEKQSPERTVLELYGDYSDRWLASGRRGANQGWTLLGAQRAQMFGADIDSFEVGRRFGNFKAIKVTAREHAVRLYGLRITYSNGETEDVPFSGELAPGQSTPPLDLRGRDRFIERIQLRYRTKFNFQGDGFVEVWGLP